jgi:hypothetical protein
MNNKEPVDLIVGVAFACIPLLFSGAGAPFESLFIGNSVSLDNRKKILKI